jgi:hypothetical protein
VAPWWSWYHKLLITNFKKKAGCPLGSKRAQRTEGHGTLLKMPSRSTNCWKSSLCCVGSAHAWISGPQGRDPKLRINYPRPNWPLTATTFTYRTGWTQCCHLIQWLCGVGNDWPVLAVPTNFSKSVGTLLETGSNNVDGFIAQSLTTHLSAGCRYIISGAKHHFWIFRPKSAWKTRHGIKIAQYWLFYSMRIVSKAKSAEQLCQYLLNQGKNCLYLLSRG